MVWENPVTTLYGVNIKIRNDPCQAVKHDFGPEALVMRNNKSYIGAVKSVPTSIGRRTVVGLGSSATVGVEDNHDYRY